ncbi:MULTISPECIES: DUF962 domain-containing protein [unclassified Paludibacterium]|uniref:Mpo1 family 2-hydroxy fatty acid dioxygenase n=1 Tax=unclassified Paludibacterium TaxID=2618429 RepID=UPI001C0446EA|nr:Mpo1-like protein [Paludibacterium sp. B53371]BEV72802.1 DUF962 domain-containing protein [Paludibacterium sp. THUN1379]
MTLQQWLQAYGASHQHRQNVAIHKLCIPLIIFSIFGVLTALPSSVSPAWLLIAGGLLFYLRLSWRMALAMLLLCGTMMLLLYGLQRAGVDLLRLSGVIFVLAWIGQFIGHRIEGRKPSFLDDLRFLLIGPAWTVAGLTHRFNIRW